MNYLFNGLAVLKIPQSVLVIRDVPKKKKKKKVGLSLFGNGFVYGLVGAGPMKWRWFLRIILCVEVEFLSPIQH